MLEGAICLTIKLGDDVTNKTLKGFVTAILGEALDTLNDADTQSLALSSVLLWLARSRTFTRARWANVDSVRYSHDQYSLSGWCIVFMLGTALQVGANHDIACIYGESHALLQGR